MKFTLLTACLCILIFTSCELSRDRLKERARAGLISYFHQKHKDVWIDSLKVVRVEKINKGAAAYKALYQIQTADSTLPGILVDVATTDKVILTKDFQVIE